MSAKPFFKQYTVTATATSLTDIMGFIGQNFFSNFVVRAKSTNAGSIYWGGSNVTAAPANAGGEIKPGESASFDLTNMFISSNSVYFVGTAGDIAYFTLVT